MRRILALACLGLLSAVLMVSRVQAQGAGTLRIGMRDDPDILDPTFSRTYVGTVVMTAICDKLFDFDAKLNIVPVLATGYEWADSKDAADPCASERHLPGRREAGCGGGGLYAGAGFERAGAASAAARSARWTMPRWRIR